MRHASGHNYRNRLFIVDLAIGQIPRSTECISSFFSNEHSSVLRDKSGAPASVDDNDNADDDEDDN